MTDLRVALALLCIIGLAYLLHAWDAKARATRRSRELNRKLYEMDRSQAFGRYDR